MKRIIAIFLCGIVMFNISQADSLVDAMKLKGVTQCTDSEASNYKQYAPCMYIVKAVYVPSKAVTKVQNRINPFNDNPTTIYNMNNPSDTRLAQLVDTSVLSSTNANYNNYLTAYDRSAQLVDTSWLYRVMRPVEMVSTNNGINTLVDTSVLTQHVNRNITAITVNTDTRTFSPKLSTLPTWFGKGFTSAQSLGDVVLYGRDGQYLAINHVKNQALFETPVNQTIQYAFTGTSGQAIFIMGSNNPSVANFAANGINNNAIYIVTDAGVVSNTGSHTVILSAANDIDNSWKQDVIIAVSFTNNTNTWNYVVMNHNGSILASGSSIANLTAVKNAALYNGVVVPTMPVVLPVIKPTTPTVSHPLTYKISYKLGTADSRGYRNIESARCNTNGTVEALWIEKRTGDNSFGIGIEINNTFTPQQYVVRPGDRICCRAINTKASHYTQAGGCEEIK